MIAVGNRFIFNSFTGEKFQGRFREATEGMKTRMIQANREMEGKVHVTYCVLIASVLVSAAALPVPNGI